MTARVFLAHQINGLVELYNVTIITNLNGNRSILDNISNKANIIDLPIERNINLLADLRALFILISIFYKNGFSLVHSVSPKAGLLTSIAAWISQVPNRLHTFTGQVWVTKEGVNRQFLKFLDKIIATLNTNVLVDSFSQQDFLINEGILSKDLSIVLGNGSISGVDLKRFQPSKMHRNLIRKQLNITDDCLVFLFIGRLKKEKGIFELVEAFKNVRKHHDNLVLIIVGLDEEGLKHELMLRLEKFIEFVRFVDFTKSPETYMNASDIFVLPSYREGFGSVIIEAASCGLPSIGSNIYGLSDAIIDGETGILVPVKSIKDLEMAMHLLTKNSKMREEMGRAANLIANDKFSQNILTDSLISLYIDLLKNDHIKIKGS